MEAFGYGDDQRCMCGLMRCKICNPEPHIPPVRLSPDIEECISIIKRLTTATRSQAMATGQESMVVKTARKRAEKFLCDIGK